MSYRLPYEDEYSSREVDTVLEAVLEEIASATRNGEPVEIEEYIERYPQHADRLRSFLSSMQILLDFGDEKSADREPASLPSEQPIAPPRTLGDFQIVREIGRGGMGIVYEAQQLSLERRVALKVLPFAAILDDRQLQRFKNEARAAAMLKHPNIVNVYSVGCERSVHFYAMELIEGPTLAELVSSLHGKAFEESHADLASVAKDRETTPIAQLSTQYQTNRHSFYRSIAALGVQTAQALHYAHERDVIHRDIKPSNLLLDASGSIQVADFGLARIQSDDGLTLSGDVLGTLRYMSPQQAEGLAIDERTDIYSLGVTLYEVLSGRPAFAARDRQTLLRGVLEELPRPLSKVDHQIPKDLITIVDKCLAKAPDVRYAKAIQVSDDLTRFLENRPILAKPTSRVSHLIRWVKRRPAVSSLVALTLCLLIFLAITGPMAAIRQAELAATLEHQLYDASITNAFDALEEGDLGVASLVLDRLSKSSNFEEYCAFEYDYLASQLRAIDAVTKLRWHTDVFSAKQCPRNESLVAFGEWGGEVRLLDVRNGDTRQLGRNDGHRNLVLALEFFHHHPLLVTTSLDGTVKLWDENSGELVSDGAKFESGVVSLDISADDSLLAVGFHRANPLTSGVRVFRITIDADAKYPFLEPVADLDIPPGVHSLSFSNDSVLLAAARSDHQLRIWRTDTWTEVESVPFQDRVACVRFSAREPRLLAVGTNLFDADHLSFSVQLIDASRPQDRTLLMSGNDGLRTVVFSPDGAEVAAGTLDGRLHFASIGAEVHRAIRGHSGFVESIDYSSDGERLLTGSRDGTIRSWKRNDLQKSGSHLDATSGGFITDLCYSHDGRELLATYVDGNARLWNLQRGKVVATFDGLCPQLFGGAVSPDGKRVATSGAEWDTGKGTLCIHRIDQPQSPVVLCESDERILDVEFIDDTTVAASVGNEIRLWNVDTRQEIRRLQRHTGLVRRLFVLRSRRVLASVTMIFETHETEVRLWDVDTGDCLQLISNRGHMAVALSPGAQLVAIGGTELLLHDRKTGLETKLRGHSSEVLFVDFSPDGKRLVSTGRDGKTKVWNVTTGNCLLTFHHKDSVWCAKFSPDGGDLAIGHSMPEWASRIEVKGTGRTESPEAKRR